jgi:hypothetical protein
MTTGPWLAPNPRLALQVSMAGALLALPQVALADGEIRASTDVTASTGWSSNPFAETGKDLSSAFVEVDVRPTISLVHEHSDIALTGLFDYQHYFRDYSDSNDYGVGLDYSGTPTARLTTHAAVNYDSSIIGGYDALSPVVNPALPLPPVTTGPDLALVGTKVRRRTLAFAGDLSYALSEYDTVTANAYYTESRYGGAISASNYNSYGGGLGYSRRVSAHLQLGVQGSVSRYAYQGGLGNSDVYSVQGTFKDQLSDRWSVNGALGVSFSSQTLGGNSTNLTGSIQLCRLGPRSTFCVNGNDAVLPTGGAGTVDSKSAGASYSYHLTEHSTVSLSGQYSHNDTPTGRFLANDGRYANSYITLSGTYDRTLRPRVHLIASTHFRKITGNLGDSPADFGGSLGIMIRFGDYR